jgi:hypothetical protein
MRGTNRWWILLLAVVLLATSACTENDLDESEASVVLEILGINNPPVTGEVELGTCSITMSLQCLDNNNCPEGEVCILPPPGGGCEITDWTVNVANKPLNEAGMETPFNDIVVRRVLASYTNLDGSLYAPDRWIPVGATIEANSMGGMTFAPIAFDDLTVDNTTINVRLGFDALTVSGEDVEVAGGQGTQLFIEDCIP